jgi:hypothetical protein
MNDLPPDSGRCFGQIKGDEKMCANCQKRSLLDSTLSGRVLAVPTGKPTSGHDLSTIELGMVQILGSIVCDDGFIWM